MTKILLDHCGHAAAIDASGGPGGSTAFGWRASKLHLPMMDLLLRATESAISTANETQPAFKSSEDLVPNPPAGGSQRSKATDPHSGQETTGTTSGSGIIAAGPGNKGDSSCETANSYWTA